MTQDEIIEIAREAGFKMENSAAIQAAETFAKLVAAKEREACAKVCDEYSAIGEYLATARKEEFDRGWLGCAKNVAGVIRDRKELA